MKKRKESGEARVQEKERKMAERKMNGKNDRKETK